MHRWQALDRLDDAALPAPTIPKIPPAQVLPRLAATADRDIVPVRTATMRSPTFTRSVRSPA